MGHAYQQPPAMPHGEFEEVLPNVFLVKGTCKIGVMRFSRNMIVIREGMDLTLVNTVRLNPEGLKKLESLGRVKNIIRLAAFHGMDDPFYKKRYNPHVWSVNAPYAKGFKKAVKLDEIYFKADDLVINNQKGPIENSSFVVIDSAKPQEALLHINKGGGILISGDALQNFEQTDQYFNFIGKLATKRMGLIKSHQVGPIWKKTVEPSMAQMRERLMLPFDVLLPAHGDPVMEGADLLYKEALEDCRPE